ncbi:MAG TPA: diaminopimelate epimerase [Streptosporangiaceae bacterium]|nr:diaminopimelate epimerase [Streptosporangiaceae bacterium]
MRFAKGHGTQNDFVVLFDPDGAHGLTSALVARVCDRRAGLGGDGVLRVVRAAAVGEVAGSGPGGDHGAGAQWFMDYRNADGSIAEMCGNGIRVFARYLASHGLVTGPEFPVATRSGTRLVRLSDDGDVTVDMGPATVVGDGQATVGGQSYPGLAVSVGNPHLACLVEDGLESFDLTAAPGLDPAQFPHGANVELVQVTSAGSLTMRVHERGSGETQSCGTGAVAAAVAADHAYGSGANGCMAEDSGADGSSADGSGGHSHDSRAWQVRVPGGRLRVVLGNGTTWLSGPAVIVAEGELAPAWLSE